MKSFYAIILTLSLAYGFSLPLLAIALEGMAASTRLIGLSAAMPALGWMVGTPFIPLALRRSSLNRLLLGLLVLALAAWVALALWRTPLAWVGLRFLFGGAMGLIYRLVEYWLTVTAPDGQRGRVIGSYNASFLAGIILGSALQPMFGVATTSFAVVFGLLALVTLAVGLRPAWPAPRVVLRWHPRDLAATLRLAPMVLAAALVYAMFEDVPAYLLSIFALRVGSSETVAALTLTACALGALIGTIPVGLLSDRIGRRRVLIGATTVGLAGAVLLPLFAHAPAGVFLSALFFWALGIEGIFVISLAHLADRFRGEALLRANVAYGIVYAAGSLVGPIYFAQAMELWNPQGLLVALALNFGVLLLVTLAGGGRRLE